MSALGHEQTYALQQAMSASNRESGLPQTVMSALPPKADMCGANRNVRLGPKADMTLCDHLVGAAEQRLRDSKAESFCRFLVDNQFVPSRALNCQIGWLGTMQYFVDVNGTLSKHIDGWMSVGQ